MPSLNRALLTTLFVVSLTFCCLAQNANGTRLEGTPAATPSPTAPCAEANQKTTLLAYLPLTGAAAGLFGVFLQLRRQWHLHSANLVTQLDERFNSAEWQDYRRQEAKKLHAHIYGNEALDLSKSFHVPGFFEHLGYLVHYKALDGKIVWNKFGWYVVGYYLALTATKNALKEYRDTEKDETIWEEFEWLYEFSVEMYSQKEVKVNDPCSRAQRVERLLAWESSLTGTTQSSQTPDGIKPY